MVLQNTANRKTPHKARSPEKDPGKPPSPFGGWSQSVETASRAIVVPPNGGAMVQPTGVLRADGSYAPMGALWRRGRAITTPPDRPSGAIETLAGRWLFAGPLWNHFGHFLTESLARLWALDHLGDLDGILFTPKRAANGAALEPYHHAFFNALGLSLPVRVITAPTRVERLEIPGQGFGLGRIVVGTPVFRRFVQTRFGAQIPAEGPKRLYVSRSRIGPKRGGFLAEERLESHLADEGYDVFHPQAHPLEVQIARYKAAQQIIGAEGSALHLVGMVARPEQDVAIVMRRSAQGTDHITAHIAAFSGRIPNRIDAIRRRWMPAKGGRAHQGVAEIDLSSAQAALTAAGYTSGRGTWASLSDQEARDRIQSERYWAANGYRPE